jgi:PhnB protein
MLMNANANYKPAGYSTVSAYLMTQDAQKVIDLLKKVFDAVELRRFDMPDGKIAHAEVKIGDTVVMFADGSPGYPAFPAWLHVYVPDVDATYKKALAAGAIAVQEPVRKEGDPDRRGGFKDPSGNTWWISTQGVVS